MDRFIAAYIVTFLTVLVFALYLELKRHENTKRKRGP